jgi:hypothetical protein
MCWHPRYLLNGTLCHKWNENPILEVACEEVHVVSFSFLDGPGGERCRSNLWDNCLRADYKICVMKEAILRVKMD